MQKLALLSILIASTVFADRPPNLLILQTDEHHYNTLSCYGSKTVKTPNIDWLARHGALCTSFYATSPVCSPSRAALVSGRYPQNTPVVNNNIPLDGKIVTFAEVLRRRGYATGYAGKWHLDGNGKPQWAPKRKFGFEDNRFMFNRGHWKKFEDTPQGPRVGARKNGKPNYNLDGADEKTFSTDWLTNKAIDFIDTNKNKSFCYMVAYPDPHGPNTVRAPYDTMYKPKNVYIPPSLQKALAQVPKWATKENRLTAGHLRKIMPAYYGMVRLIDDNIGRIIETLRKNNILENTMIVFTSDHGDLCGEHCRLNKGNPYEGSARIPFVLYFPPKVKGGNVIPQALSCVDFFPTTMTLMGHADALKDKGVVSEGRDASPLFRGENVEWNDISFLRMGGWVSAVSDRYKVVYSASDKPWFFDLEKDPAEMSNLFGKPEYNQIIKTMTKQLLEYTQEYKDPHGNDGSKIRAAMEAVLGN